MRGYSKPSPAMKAKMKEKATARKTALKKMMKAPGKAVVMVVKKMKRK